MDGLTVKPLGYALGAEVDGVDIASPLDDATIAQIRQACLDHVVIRLRRQAVSAEQLREFCARFGRLDDYRGFPNRDPNRPDVLILASKPVIENGHRTGGQPTLAIKWHADGAFTDHPETFAFLQAKALPDVGGETMFANMYLAYENLSPAFARMIEPLSGVHDYTKGHAYTQSSSDEQAKMRAVKPLAVHRLVREHPETGRKALFFNGRIRNFIGMTEEETQPILDFLHAHALRYEFTYRHRWAVDDLLMWDNRCSMHIALHDYDQTQLRMMYQCAIVGEKSGYLLTESAVPQIAAAGG